MKKEKVGRPSGYSEEILEKVKKYLKETKDTFSIKGKLVDLPTIAGLAIYLGVHKDTLYEWAKIHKEFSDLLKSVLAEQEKRLINNGLSGNYNSIITKLILAKHGYYDKQDITSDNQPINPVLVKFINGEEKCNNDTD